MNLQKDNLFLQKYIFHLKKKKSKLEKSNISLNYDKIVLQKAK
jgi:hypothetical protein